MAVVPVAATTSMTLVMGRGNCGAGRGRDDRGRSGAPVLALTMERAPWPQVTAAMAVLSRPQASGSRQEAIPS